MTYPGGKNGDGVYQRLINLMPPHTVYIEPFLGGGAILRRKKPASLNIGIDRDPQVIRAWQACTAENDDASGGIAGPDDTAGRMAGTHPERFRFAVGDGITFLQSYPFRGGELVYCDPPYLRATRRRSNLYRYEMTDTQHKALLAIITTLPCMVMISGYASALYQETLRSWNSIRFQAMTRGGRVATEWLWYNYPAPLALHDYSYLGDTFRERERIKRKKHRWVNRLQTMPILERRALLAAISEAWPGIPSPDLTIPAGIAVSDATISHR
jgi:DNA adenine methylase